MGRGWGQQGGTHSWPLVVSPLDGGWHLSTMQECREHRVRGVLGRCDLMGNLRDRGLRMQGLDEGIHSGWLYTYHTAVVDNLVEEALNLRLEAIRLDNKSSLRHFPCRFTVDLRRPAGGLDGCFAGADMHGGNVLVTLRALLDNVYRFA